MDKINKSLVAAIVKVATNDIGIEEITPNQGWYNKPYEDFMLRVLHYKLGHPWCVYAAVKSWLHAVKDFDSLVVTEVLSVFDPLAQAFYNKIRFGNFKYLSVQQEPIIGGIAIWAYYNNNKASYTGHAALVVGIEESFLTTIDGNTNLGGHREGTVIAKKTRNILNKPENGLRYKGCIKLTI